MLRSYVSRFASPIAAFALILSLAGCGGNSIVPAPLEMPQFPGGGPPPSPVREALPAPASNGPIKVALLVPLSGPNTELGKAMLEAAQLALFTTGSERLTLVPRDSSGSPDGAAAAARSALAEGARLILGPLLAAEVEAVKPVAQSAHVNVIAFSTATPLAGGNTFLMGFLPRQEVAREAAVAHAKGLNRFAALAPNSQYGHLMVDALREAVAAVGGTVTKVEYIDTGSDPTPAIKRLLSIDPASAAPPAAATPDFDALLLPEGDGPLKQIAHQLRAAGLDTAKVRLLGSGLWDDPSIAGEPALDGGWFAASPPDPEQEFENRFQKTYGRPAPRLASLAFDAAALAAVLAQNGGDHPFPREAILNPSGFTGVDGLFRFTQQGLVQRGLAVIEVGPQGNGVVSPAPQNFQDLAY